jgi:D-sedoheptulose 7-phosphate isomerase
MYNLSEAIEVSISTKKSLLSEEKKINKAIKIISKALKNGNKILLCGNGGSAADAQHLAAEFLVRLRPNVNRKPIPAISLSNDASSITACGNDYNFDDIFSRNLEALYKPGDILIVISTSGNSKNIINALKFCKRKKIQTIGFLGNDGGKAKKICKIPIIVNSNITARIQESHIFLGHFIFEKVEDEIISKKKKKYNRR